jgi:hypothetical protein
MSVRRAGDNPDLYTRNPGAPQHPSELVRGMAGGHDVVDNGDMCGSRKLADYAEGAAQVSTPQFGRRQGLRPGMPVTLALAVIDRHGQAPTEAARQFRGLVEAAFR